MRKKNIPFWLSLLAVLAVIFEFGFYQTHGLQAILFYLYLITLATGIVAVILRYIPLRNSPGFKVWIIDSLLLLFLIISLLNFLGVFSFGLPDSKVWVFLSVFSIFMRELSSLNIALSSEYLSPAQLFIFSFFTIILLGAILLTLPKATHHGISYLDALFTATSAVCVTGLVVVDTGSYFTLFGQTIIIVLIQVGGLGIMTFASYFSYFFRGGTTYENQLALRDMSNTDKIADVFNTLKKIILISFIVEGVGAVFIYTFLDPAIIPTMKDRAFFAVFHTISAFCNAGFSTLPNSLYETGFRYNYGLHLSIAFLFVIGGVGFPIIFNFFKYLKYLIINHLLRFTRSQKAIYIPWIVNINTRIVLITTSLLIVGGTLFFYAAEYNNTLAEHSGFGKIVTAFFGAVTPRTAGFNSVDMSALHLSTVMVIFMLMWVGASPASTGGGIKTSTFAIATLNFMSLARGKTQIELFRREIADQSVRRAFAIIALSLIVIAVAMLFVVSFDSDQELLPIAFECFSAYSTVGLSLGLTASLSSASKLVLIITMFIGRVSMLTILIAMMRKVKYLNYRYPSEEILIN